jgi:hypothetical protein
VGARTRSLWPQRTTFWAGVCFVVAAVLAVLVFTQFAVAVTKSFSLFIPNPIAMVLAAAVRAAGFVIAALGLGGEAGVVAGSRLGKAALILFGVGDLVYAVEDLFPFGTAEGPPSPVLLVANTALAVAIPIAALVAALIVYRVAVLGGVARWILLPIAVVDLVLLALEFGPFRDLLVALNLLPIEFLQPALLAALGAAYLVHGRGEAVKHRAQVINENW